LKGEWCYTRQAFTESECNEIVNIGLSSELGSGVIGDGVWGNGSVTDTEYRNSDLRFIHQKDPGTNWIFDKMWRLAIDANKHWFGFHLEEIESFQFTQYDGSKQQHYKEHVDVFWVTNKPSHRKLSAVLQLSNPDAYVGGDLEFNRIDEYPDEGQKQEMKMKGSIIFFPSFVYHYVSPVTLGMRHSLVMWIDGPKWR
tara:strand:- start:8406 stop:8996 length:591 start_codon:yes stop_codon:yes gene_type:complete